MKRRVIVYFIVTFLLGALAGAGGGSLYRKYVRQGRRAPTRQDVVKHLKQELSLNDEQSGRVQQIIEDMRDKHGEVHKDSDQQHAAMRGNRTGADPGGHYRRATGTVRSDGREV